MPKVFIETNNEKSHPEHTNNALTQWIELKELSKQRHRVALPFDVMSMIFDHVKTENVKTYRAVLPKVSKEWNRFVKLKDAQLQTLPLYRELEILLAHYLTDAEKNQKIRDLIPHKKQQREKNITQLFHMIKEDLQNNKIEHLVEKLHLMISNSDDEKQTKVFTNAFRLIFNSAIDVDKIKMVILDIITKNNKIGAYPDKDNKWSYVERLLDSLLDSDEAKLADKIFVIDCYLYGFENNNFIRDSRIDKLGKNINKLVELHGNDPVKGEDLRNLEQRYSVVSPRFQLPNPASYLPII